MKEENKELKELSIWYAQESAKIIETHGQPNKSEESKRLHKNLRQAKSRKLRELKSQRTIEDIKAQIQSSTIDQVSLKWNVEDLAAYDPIEQLILMKHFSNMALSNSDIAKSLHEEQVSSQQVTALLERSDVNDLVNRLFAADIGKALQIALMKGLASVDNRQWVDIALKHGFSPTGTKVGTCDHQLSKPIEDPEAMRLLQELGDRLATKEQTSEGYLNPSKASE